MSYNVSDIERTSGNKKNSIEYFGSIIYKTGGVIEILLILFVWWFVFTQNETFGGFTRNEMITYILFGNMIGIVTSFFLQNLIVDEANSKKSDLLIYTPVKYFFRLFKNGLGRNFIPFLLMLTFHISALYFLQDSIATNSSFLHLLVITLMLALSFIVEFLLVYLSNLYIFWTIESDARRKFIIRIKKFLAGSYIPLSLLPFSVMFLGLIFPFAYSFFIPSELYLKKIDISYGVMGLFVQSFWIVLLYLLVKWKWRQKKNEEEPETDKIDINS
jgi:ABC-2 type transport system permease protein